MGRDVNLYPGNGGIVRQYFIGQAAVAAVLESAPQVSGGSSADSEDAEKTLQGTASVSDSEGSKLVLNVGVKDGKIVSLAADASSVSNWDSILSKLSSNYIGKSADGSDNTTGYVFGAAGGNWSEIFSEIKESQGITTTTTTTVHTKGVVITDTLSQYVDLANTSSSDNYGISVTASDGSAVPTFTASYNEGTRTVTVTFAADFELKDGVTYTANIPVQTNAAAHEAANAASSDTTTLPTNDGAKLTYKYGDGDAKDADYEEEPTVTVEKETSYESGGDTGVTLHKTAEKVAGKDDEFDITLTIDTEETATSTTFQEAIGTYMASADIFYGPSNPYKNSTANAYKDSKGNVLNGCLIDTSSLNYTCTVSGTTYRHMPEDNLGMLDTSPSGGSKEVTYKFFNSAGEKIAEVKLYSGMNNYHAYVRLDETHFLSVGHGISKGGTVNINLTDDALDYLMETIYKTTTVTTSSSITLNSVTDKMGEYVNYVAGSAVANGGTVTPTDNNRTLVWDPITRNPNAVSVVTTSTEGSTTTTTIKTTNAATLTYRVKVNTEKEGFKYSTEYPANEKATLNYSDPDGDKTKDFPVPKVKVDGYFYVYHTGVDGGKLETIDMSTLTDGTYNLTQNLTANTLYGGYYLRNGITTVPTDGKAYTGVNWTFATAQEENGLSMHPKKGETYYVKEVPVTYLVPASYIIYDKSKPSDDENGYKVVNLFLTTGVDDDTYKSVGFTVKGRSKVSNADIADVARCKEFKITQAGKDYQTLDAKNLFGVPGGNLGIHNVTESLLVDQAIFTYIPYWVTPDGLKVTAARQYTQRIADGYYYANWAAPGIRKSLTKATSSIAPAPVTMNAAGPKKIGLLSVYRYADPTNPGITITKIERGGTTTEVLEEPGDYTGRIEATVSEGETFAGWYLDEAFTYPADFSNVESDMTVYAKYISADDLSMKVTSGIISSKKVKLKAKVSVNRTDAFAEVGAYYAANGKEYKVVSTAVAKSLSKKKAGETRYNIYTYTMSRKLTGVTAKTKITVTPYFVTEDGTEVRGAAQTFAVSGSRVKALG